MSSEESRSNLPFSTLPGEFVEGTLLEAPDPVGWVVHVAVGKPQATENQTIWAWCKVEAEKPGYTEIVFTLSDGTTPADPYPKPTDDSPQRPVRLGPVLFKVFC